jgi:hypothetical protein
LRDDDDPNCKSISKEAPTAARPTDEMCLDARSFQRLQQSGEQRIVAAIAC